ncbi:MAG: hypothetical protein ACKO1M_15800 [Planctomycetota bacterium]
MKRFLGFSLAMFFALVAIALVGGDSGAVAGHGCHGRKCHGGLMAKHRAKKAARKAAKCHGEDVAPACESGCGEVASDCGSCGGEVASDGGSCGGEVVSGGCAGGDCGGEGVIVSEGAASEGVPTEAPAAPAEPAKT